MRKNNLTSDFLGLLKSKGKIDDITDPDGIQIPTIKINEDFAPIEYLQPKITYDKFLEDKEIEPDIKNIMTIEPILELGVVIVSKRVGKKKSFKMQSARYDVKRKDSIGEDKTTKSMPPNHYLEYDRANMKVRLRGRNCKSSAGKTGEESIVLIEQFHSMAEPLI